MALIQEAYLFNPKLFYDAINPYLESVSRAADGYAKLRIHALEVFENNPRVRSLCKHYGGWSRSAIETQFPTNEAGSIEDTAFWLVVLLYSSFDGREEYRIGLGPEYHELDKILEVLDWHDEKRALLLWGHRFDDLPVWLPGSEVSVQDQRASSYHDVVWKYIRPFSTSSNAGWLAVDEVLQLHNDLKALKPKLHEKIDQMHHPNPKIVSKVFESAIEMLSMARKKKTGLCLISSG